MFSSNPTVSLVVPDPLHVSWATPSVGLSSIFLFPSVLELEKEDLGSRGSPGTARVATCPATGLWTLQEEVICGKWAGQDKGGPKAPKHFYQRLSQNLEVSQPCFEIY